MCKSASLDKLAQLPTATQSGGVGSRNLSKRARSKYYTNKIVGHLLYLDSPMHKQYQRAYYCNSNIVQNGKTLTAKYCNSRACHICNRIRTAKFINGYKQPLQDLGELEFTTLTVPNVTKDKLRDTITKMCKNLSNIVRVLREKRNIKLSGIRKIECTYNANTDTYHPHLHIITDCATGAIIIDEWLCRYTNASRRAQDTRKCDENSFLELFKYTTKIATKTIKGQGWDVHIPALDVIMCALDKKRTFQPFGKIKKVSEEVDELQSVVVEELNPNHYAEWEYNELTSDWHNIYIPCARLTRYKPPDLQLNIYV